MKKLLLFFLILPLLISCSQNQPKKTQIYKDNFTYNIKPFWQKELTDSSKASIVQDPLNKENTVLMITHNLKDYIAKGFRSEIKIPFNDSACYRTDYSFKFFLADSFFEKKGSDSKEWIIIHQWHARIDKKNITPPNINLELSRPPIALSINNDYLVLGTGVKSISHKITYTRFEDKLIPNIWYTFSCKILWSIDNNGYVEAKLNGEYFKNEEGGNRIYNRNMYNILPNYFKMGLYRSNNGPVNRTILFDDFYLEPQI